MGQTSRDPLYKRSSAHRALVTALIDHFGLLHDYTRTLNPGFTTGLTLYVVIFQAFTINRPLDYALDSLGLNELSASIIVVLLISVPIFLLISTVAFIIMETRVKRRLDNLPDEVHAHSAWYTIYAYVYRFSFFVTEPATTGFVLSALIGYNDPSYQTKEAVGKKSTLVLIAPVIIGQVQSLIYLVFVESILPGRSLLSATNKSHMLCLNIIPKLTLAVDAVQSTLKIGSSKVSLLVLLCFVKAVPSLLVLPVVAFRTHFFHKYARCYALMYHLMSMVFIAVSDLREFLWPNHNTNMILVTILMFLMLAVKVAINTDVWVSKRILDTENLSLPSLIGLAEVCLTYLQREEIIQTDLNAAFLQMISLLKKTIQTNKPTGNSSLENWMNHDSDITRDDVVDYLVLTFQKHMRRQPSSSQAVKIYLIYYVMKLRVNVYKLGTLFGELRRTYIHLENLTAFQSLERQMKFILEGYALGRISFTENSMAYEPEPKSNTTQFNLAEILDVSHTHRNMTSEMLAIISRVVLMFDLRRRNDMDYSLLHETVTIVRKSIRNLWFSFMKIEQKSLLRYKFHLLPFGLFLDTVDGDRLSLAKFIRIYEERSTLGYGNLKKIGTAWASERLSAKTMVTLSIACSRGSLGRIVDASRNFEIVYGIHWQNLVHKLIHDLVSRDFRDMHPAMFKDFMMFHNKDYLGKSFVRYARFTENPNLYSRVKMITKVTPTIDTDGIIFISLVEKMELSEPTLLLSDDGTINGYNQALVEKATALMQYVGCQLGSLSRELKGIFHSKLISTIIQNSMVQPEEVKLLKDRLNISFNTIQAYSDPAFIQKVAVLVRDVEAKDQSISSMGCNALFRLQSVSIEPTVAKYLDKIIIEAALILDVDWSLSKIHKQNSYFRVMGPSQPMLSQTQLSSSSASLAIRGSHIMQSKADAGRYFGDSKTVSTTMRIVKSNNVYQPTAQSQLDNNPRKILAGLNNTTPSMKQTAAKHVTTEPVKQNAVSETEIETESTSTNKTGNTLRRLNAAIVKQQSYYIWKESAAIVLFQLALLIISIVIIAELYSNFYTEMTDIIKLRTGIVSFTMANSALWATTIQMFHEMLARANILTRDTNRMFLPGYPSSFEIEYAADYGRIRNFSGQFIENVYSARHDLGSRYLLYKSTYSTRLSDSVPQAGLNIINADMIDVYKFALYALRRWKIQLDKLPTMQPRDFDINAITELLNVIGSGLLELIATPTIVLLMDSDVAIYKKLTQSTKNSIWIATMCSIVLSFGVIGIVVLVKRKVNFVYSAFNKLYHFEVVQEISKLEGVKRMVKHSSFNEPLFLKEFQESFARKGTRRDVQSNYSAVNRKRVTRKTVKFDVFKNHLHLFDFVIGCFVLMQIFNIISLLILPKLTSDTNAKLDMLAISRASLSGTAGLHNVMCRAYALSIQKHFEPFANYYNITKLTPWILNAATFFDTQIAKIDTYYANNISGHEPIRQAGMQMFAESPPCDFVDLKRFNCTYQECQQLGSRSMAQSPQRVYHWLRSSMKNILAVLLTSNQSNALDLLSNPEFIETNIIRNIFIRAFVYRFNTTFFEKVMDFHEQIRVLIKYALVWILFFSTLATILLDIIGFTHMHRQVTIALTSLRLIPADSFTKNPYVALVLKQLS